MNENVEALKAYAQAAGAEPLTRAERRAQMDSFPQPLPGGVRLLGELLTVDDARPDVVVLYLHGGGYEIGSPRSHRRLAAMVCRSARADGLLVDYRLAPEDPCPAAVDDAVDACRHLQRDGRRVIIAGDSAGGGLALATLLVLRYAGDPLPAAAVLLAPWVDLTCSGPSMRTRADRDFILDEAGLRAAAASYAGDRPLDDPVVSPLFADLSGLPPLLVEVGDDDMLLDDATRLAERSVAAGVDTTLEVVPEMPHVFHAFDVLLPEAATAFDRIAQWLDRLLVR